MEEKVTMSLKRKSSADYSTPSKSNPSCYPLCFVFPNTDSQQIFVDRGNIDHTIHVPGEVATLDVISYSGLKVIIASPTRSSLKAVFTTLRQHLRQDADIVIFNAALIKQVLKASPGTCHRLTLCDYVGPAQVSTASTCHQLKLCLPNLQIDLTSTLMSGQFYFLSCSSWAKGKKTSDGLAKFEIQPNDFECFVQDKWMLHHVAVCIGNSETIRSDDVLQAAFNRSTAIIVTGAYDVLKHYKSSGVVTKAIHLASSIVVPAAILTSQDDISPDRVLPYPRNTEDLERNQKVISDFFRLSIHSHLEPRKIKQFALLLFDGDEQKYDECCQALGPTDETDELLHQIFLEYKSIAGNDIDFSKLKQVFNQMVNKELSDMCNHFYVEHSFSFRVHHFDCDH